MSHSTRPTPREKELSALLDKERAALNTLANAKTKLEEELESLTQALFEEVSWIYTRSLILLPGWVGSSAVSFRPHPAFGVDHS
jgi:hypothetical protein